MMNIKNFFQKLFTIASLILISVMYQNCGKSDPAFQDKSLEQETASGTQNQALKLMQEKCQNCHSDGVQSGGVGDLTDPNYDYNERLILPTEPELSPILQVSLGEMPSHPSVVMTSEDTSILKNWIVNLDPTTITGKPPAEIPLDATFKGIQANILLAKCDGCHATQNPNVRFNTYEATMKTVIARDTTNSKLLNRLKGIGNIMPTANSGFGPLSSAEIKYVNDWIAAGAMNN